MKEREFGGIRCSEVLASLSDFVDGDVEPAARKRIEQHLESCSNCARFGEQFSGMVSALADFSEVNEEDLGLLRLAMQRVKGPDSPE